MRENETGRIYQQEMSPEEVFVHELSHALDDAQGRVTRSSKYETEMVAVSQYKVSKIEARAINRTNDYRDKKNMGYKRTGRDASRY